MANYLCECDMETNSLEIYLTLIILSAVRQDAHINCLVLASMEKVLQSRPPQLLPWECQT